MTTIVACELADRVIVGCDSKITDGSGEWWSHSKARKVLERGEIIIGGCGELAACDIALHIWKPPKSNATDRKDYYHFVISKLIPSLKKCFKDNDCDAPKFNFIIVIGGEVFEFSDDFGVVMREEGHHGIGSGSDLAMGALRSGKTVLEALEIAAAHDSLTGAPFYTYEQFKK